MSQVLLQTGQGTICRIACGKTLQEFAMRWNYIVRQQQRWADDDEARARQAKRLQRDLRRIGVTAKQLKRLRGIVQVGVPDSQTDQYWEARILPWEYVLAAASDSYRRGESILVVRHLRTGRRRQTRRAKNFAVIESAPGELDSYFDFSAQRNLVIASLNPLEASVGQPVVNPRASDLKSALSRTSPDLIHLSAVDNRSGRRLLDSDLDGVRDGLYLSDSDGQAKEYRAEQVSELLNAGTSHPLLVGLNCWESGARLAPMTIQAGANAAVGFQHSATAAIAEDFFLRFYRLYVATDGNLLAAFYDAWNRVSTDHRQMLGSSIVVWSADSLISDARLRAFDHWVETRESGGHRASRITAQLRAADPSTDSIESLLRVSVQPVSQLNFSALHNGESLFDEFTLRFEPESLKLISQVKDVDIDVQLHVGTQRYPFQTRVTLDANEPRQDIGDQVCLPLTGELFRQINEPLQANLFVEVRWHGQTLYRKTHPVWLAPADQWTLDHHQIGWLPSFVQPRDPAVSKTIDLAQDYLRCLADCVTVGFDGYQSYDGTANPDQRWIGVDQQVRAIWSSLLLDTKLRYINPPPSYAQFTQRLRSPSVTIGSRFGTCVDLAILFASCLEWIEINPVLFLMHGHAFPGYWKDIEAHQRFRDVVADDLMFTDPQSGIAEDRELPGWVSGRKTYSEIRGLIDRGELVPLESVGLTASKGFQDAVDGGRDHFYKKHNRAFSAMIDLVSARENGGVTPLPIVLNPTS